MRTAPRRIVAAFTVASLVIGAPGAVAAQEDSFDAAVDALGGAEALQGLTSFVVESAGQRAALDEGPLPGEGVGLAGAFTSTATHDLASDAMTIDSEIEATEFGPPRSVSETVTGEVGFVEGHFAIPVPPGTAPLLSDRVMSIRTHQALLNPHLLLLEALEDPSIATSMDGSVEIAHGPTPITLSLDPSTGRIASASTMESDPLRRDVELSVAYDDWTETSSGVSFPGSVTVTYDGEVVHEETRTVSTDVEPDPARFAIPEGIEPTFDAELAQRGDVNHQLLQSFAAGGFPLDGRQLNVEAMEVAPGVWFIAGGTHNSLAVVQDEGIVLVEAPLDETRTGAILEWLATAAPDLPVTHVVQSHHHVDHSGGLRSMAGATGATVVAGESAIPFYEAEAFGVPSEIVPDGMTDIPIQTMGVGAEPLVLESGANPVTVMAFPNPHAEDMVVVEAGGTLWLVDIYNPGFVPGGPPAAISAAIEASGLPVTQIAGGHGGVEPWPPAGVASEGAGASGEPASPGESPAG